MSERVDVTTMTREERQAWLAATKPRHDLAEIIRAHTFQASRDWPDGTKPNAPNWNPGCRCGEAMYFFEHDGHLADVILAASPALSESPREFRAVLRAALRSEPSEVKR